MKAWFQKLAMKWFLGDLQEKLLSKLPGNGYKTLISFVITMLVVVLAIMGEADVSYKSILEWIVVLLHGQGADTVLTGADITLMISSLTTLVGLYHKALKRLSALAVLLVLFAVMQASPAYAQVKGIATTASQTMTLASALAVTADAAGTAVYVPVCGSGIRVDLLTTNNSGTKPTLDVKVQDSYNGTTWFDVPEANFTQATTSTSTQTMHFNRSIVHFGPRLRLYYNVGGTDPKYTVSAYLRHSCK